MQPLHPIENTTAMAEAHIAELHAAAAQARRVKAAKLARRADRRAQRDAAQPSRGRRRPSLRRLIGLADGSSR